MNTGLSEVISNAFMTISSSKTFPEAAYIYSAVLNMAVPKLLLDVFGDMTTNVIQPFWALPYLTQCHIDFKKLLPYTLVICLGGFAAPFVLLALAVAGLALNLSVKRP